MTHKRREFSRAIRVEVIKRSTKGSVVYCEACGLPAKRFEIDHKTADGLGGKPVIENASLICEACFKIKNPADTSAIAKAKRREAIHVGATKPAGQIKSAPFPGKKAPRTDRIPVPARVKDIFGRPL